MTCNSITDGHQATLECRSAITGGVFTTTVIDLDSNGLATSTRTTTASPGGAAFNAFGIQVRNQASHAPVVSDQR
jgi:hypothetical protein